MIEFHYHAAFEKEVAALERRRLPFLRASLDAFKKLCEVHFHPTAPQTRIAPGKIHRVIQNDIWAMWKTELPVLKSDLRPNQYPRIWFVHSGATIVFLCISSHVDNYQHDEMTRVALDRVTDFF